MSEAVPRWIGSWIGPACVAAASMTAVLAGCAGMATPRAAISAPAPPMSDGTESIAREGTAAPEVEAPDQRAKTFRVGPGAAKWLVLYFYPMDFAAGAGAEAEAFRDDHAKYRKLGAQIVGVSTDDVASHKDFAARKQLPFILLSDADQRIARAYGVPLQAGTATHVTFLIDRAGVIRKVWKKVRPWGHSAEVLAAIKDLSR